MLSDTMMLGGGRRAAYSIENSLLFSGERYLSRTTTAADSITTKASVDAWLRLQPGQETHFINWTSRDNTYAFCGWVRANGQICLGRVTRGTSDWLWACGSAGTVRDASGFVHLHLDVDTTLDPPANRVQCWVNGRMITFAYDSSFGVGNISPAKNEPLYCCSTGAPMSIGRYGYQDQVRGNMNLASYILVTGGNADRTLFAEVDPVTGSWRPKKFTGITWGANGFYLGDPWNSAGLGTDASGNGNHWTPNGFSATDVVKDSPTNVYPTMMPVSPVASGTFSAGNLTFTSGLADAYAIGTTAIPTSGSWCWEVQASTLTAANMVLGIVRQGLSTALELRNVGTGNAYSYSNIGVKSDGSGGNGTSYGASFIAADVIGVVYNASAGEITFYKNGASLGVAYSGLGGVFMPAFGDAADSHSGTVISVNFGQRPFAYPSAYGAAKPLCTANLPATTGQVSGSFTGNASADGPCVYTGAVPLTLTINSNAVNWGTHADKLATGFKIRTASTSYNSTGANTWTATYDRKPTVGPKGRAPANAQVNP